MTTLKRYNGTDWETIGLPVNVGMSPQTIGYAEVTANQSGITTETDLTGLTTTVTVPAGRRIRITAKTWPASSVAGDEVDTRIKEGAFFLQYARTKMGGLGSEDQFTSVVITPPAGIHTYKVSMARASGTGSITNAADITYPSYILVEDITGSTLPYQPASVPVGQIGYAVVVANQGSIAGSNVDLTGLTVNIVVPAGRTIRITSRVYWTSTVATDEAFTGIFEGATQLQEDRNVIDAAKPVHPSVILSPSAGAHTYKIAGRRINGSGTLTSNASATFPAFILVEDITPTPAPSSGAPGSTLNYAEVVANQGTFTAETDLTGLAVTVTVPAGRRIRVSASTLMLSSVLTDEVGLIIKEGGTTLRGQQQIANAGSGANSFEPSVVLTPSAGTHTYKLVGRRANGTGNVTMYASATNPAFILVEDITGSVWPEGSEITAGMVASEAWTDFSPVVTQGVALGLTVTYCRLTKVGRIVTIQGLITFTSSGTAGAQVFLTLPIAAAGVAYRHIGIASFYASGAQYHLMATLNNSSTIVRFQYAHLTNDSNLGLNAPFTGAVVNTNNMSFSLSYEAAA
jgi:hypothetical protein